MSDKKPQHLEDLDVAKRDEVRKRVEQRRQILANRREERRIDDLRTVLKQAEGRRVFWELMAETHLFQDPVVKGDDSATFANIGEARVGFRIHRLLATNFPEAYHQMTMEYAAQIKQDKTEEKLIFEEVVRNG